MKNVALISVFNFFLVFSIFAQGKQVVYSYNDVVSKDFFFGFGFKGNVFVNKNAFQDLEIWTEPALGVNMFAGHWFSKYVGGRILLEGGKVKPYFQRRTIMVEENYYLSRVDFLLDLTNMLCGCSIKRFYNLIPYAGVSGAYVFNAENRPDNATKSTSFFFGVGLWNSFRLSDNLSACLNLGLDVVDANFDGSKNTRKLNGFASASLGFVIDF